MAGLTRKKVKVRSKSGKTYQRSVMVRAESKSSRAGAKVTAGEALRKHGLAALTLGGAAGAGTALAGLGTFHAAGLAMKGRKGNAITHMSRAATLGTAASIGGAFAGGALAERTKRVKRMKSELNSRGATTGARVALGAATILGGAASMAGTIWAHNKAVDRGHLGGWRR
jgi:hypothetical protein